MIERYKGTLMSITPNEYLPLFSKSKILEDLENVLSFNRNASDTKKCLSLCNYNIEEEGLWLSAFIVPSFYSSSYPAGMNTNWEDDEIEIMADYINYYNLRPEGYNGELRREIENFINFGCDWKSFLVSARGDEFFPYYDVENEVETRSYNSVRQVLADLERNKQLIVDNFFDNIIDFGRENMLLKKISENKRAVELPDRI